MTDVDLRGSRVALVADELINGDAAGYDVLGVLESAGWGAVLLPPAWYPETATGPLLEAIADQMHEYTRHGYAIALVGERAGLADALARAGVPAPAALAATTAAELTTALETAAAGLAPHDAAATQRRATGDSGA